MKTLTLLGILHSRRKGLPEGGLGEFRRMHNAFPRETHVSFTVVHLEDLIPPARSGFMLQVCLTHATSRRLCHGLYSLHLDVSSLFLVVFLFFQHLPQSRQIVPVHRNPSK